jgi:hypothetical protein
LDGLSTEFTALKRIKKFRQNFERKNRGKIGREREEEGKKLDLKDKKLFLKNK